MRRAGRLATGRTVYRPQDSRVRDRDLSEFRYRLPPAIVLATLMALSLGLWAAIWALVRWLF